MVAGRRPRRANGEDGASAHFLDTCNIVDEYSDARPSTLLLVYLHGNIYRVVIVTIIS